MIVSGSEIATINECEMRWYYQFGLGLFPRDSTIPIKKGNAGHTNQQQFFEAIRDGATKQEALQAIAPVAQDAESLQAAYLSFKFCEKFNVDSGRPIAVEEKFIVPLDGRVKMGLTPDLIWEFNSGRQQLIDWKLTERSWSDEGADAHYQLPAYRYHLNKHCGFNITDQAYVFFNTRSDAKNLYRIKPISLTDKECENVVQDQIKAIDKLIEFHESPVSYTRLAAARVNNNHVCTYCPFKTPCRFERMGRDASATLALQYTKNTYGYGDDTDE